MAPVLEPGLELPCPLCTAPVVAIPAVAGVTWATWVERIGLVLSHHDVPAPGVGGMVQRPTIAPDDFTVWEGLAATCPMSGQAVRVRR